jgi:DNA-binding transcriptional LysR family regulator
MEEIIAYVRAGRGVAYLPVATSSAITPRGVPFVPVAGVPPAQVGLAWAPTSRRGTSRTC